MSLGIFMKAFNAIHFNKLIDFFFEFIPQIVLMSVLFGWMDFLIIAKWLHPWDYQGASAPGIISIMINMFLDFGKVGDDVDPIIGETNDKLTQQSISNTLVIIALVCVPLMLFVKPLYLLTQHDDKPSKAKKDGHSRYFEFENEEEEKIDPSLDVQKDDLDHDQMRLEFDEVLQKEAGISEDHSFSEIFIHQLIETIEFVLGTISNTASYLRLWALSLAHSQLSAVFFDKLIGEMALHGTGSPILLFFLFPVWASFTFFVLM